MLRHSIPAEEIVAAARELDADCIVIGSQGRSCKQWMRRVFGGSTSRQILRHAPCPVLVVSPSQIPLSYSLVTWYKEAITRSLLEDPDLLRVLTPDEMAHTFAPPDGAVGRKEVEAALRALEQLSHTGKLVCHSVRGQLRSMND